MRRITLQKGVRAERTLRAPSVRLNLEALEDRLVPSAAGYATPGAFLVSAAGALPNGGPGQPYGFSPQQIAQAYGFNQISFNGVRGDGSGQTIAIVDAYSQPNIASDLATFDSTYGLPAPPSFSVVNQNGGGSLPSYDSNWGLEISLDVEWAHAVAPGANIVLVETNSNSYSDLLTGVDYARNLPGVSVVSMSWGGGEFGGDTSYDGYFTTPAGHQGVSFVASSGDSGSTGTPDFPAASKNVLAVGGTQLSTDTSGNYQGEVAWSGSGGGISTMEAQPNYQRGVVTQTSTYRGVPDVSYAGSDASPFAIYDTPYGGWEAVYGTSAGAPQWAALVAIADQGRALNGQGSLDGGTQLLPALYQLPQSDFHDITSGSNGAFSAGAGYDLVTGRGSPVANLIVAGLVGQSGQPANPPWVVTPASASPSPVTGTTTRLSVQGNDNLGAASLTYTWSVVSAPSGAGSPVFSANGTNAAQNVTVTFQAAGTYTFRATITDPNGAWVTSDATVTVNQTLSGLTLTPAGQTVTDGRSLQFTATATDQFGHAMSSQPGWSWSLSGNGSLGGGLYTAPGSGNGSATVSVSGDGLTASVTVNFQAPPSPVQSNPVQVWGNWFQVVNSWLSQLSQVQNLWQILLHSWHF